MLSVLLLKKEDVCKLLCVTLNCSQKLQDPVMPEGNIPAAKFARNGAEEVLYRSEQHNTRQDPDRLPRWRRKASAACSSLPPVTLSDTGSEVADLSDHFDQDIHEDTVVEDSSLAPQLSIVLKPLPPPSPVGGSPFKGVLGFLHKDPFELEAKREAALRRDVKQMLRQIYRRSVEATGSCFRAEDPPWPPKERQLDLPRIKKVSPLKRWVFALPKQETVVPKKAKALLPSDPVNLARQATVQTMRAFGRSGQGGPYTLRQIYEEVEADVHHRPPVDVRASTGRLGPEILGPGTTRQRRKLPFAHPQMLTDNHRSKSAGSLPRGPFVPDLWT